MKMKRSGCDEDGWKMVIARLKVCSFFPQDPNIDQMYTRFSLQVPNINSD